MSNVYEEAIVKWGKDAQIKQAIEEFSELITALCHADRGRRGHPSDVPVKESITDELADCEIMMEQIRLIFSISREEIDDIRVIKIARLKTFLNYKGQ